MKKILMILTSHEEMLNTDQKTGVWLAEFTEPYYIFIENGHEVILSSPQGGEPPIDPLSELTKNISASNRKFKEDSLAQAKFKNTTSINKIDPNLYDGLFIPGGHGPLWDLANSTQCGEIINDFVKRNKPVAALCHGPAAFIKAAELNPGLLKGKRVTGFTNFEEATVFRSENIPYNLEDKLKELGADFKSSTIPHTGHVEVDGKIVTGQNPLSASKTAHEFLKLI